jgi:hypothetical protein
MKIMECRQDQIEQALLGLDAAQVPLVSLNHGAYCPAGFSDDLGIYYFIPWIAKTFGISTDLAIQLFFGSLIFIGAAISFFCFFFVFKQWTARSISFVGLGLLTYGAYRYSDVYIAPFFAVTALVPLFILCKPRSWRLLLTLGFSGLVLGYSNMIRSHGGTGTLLFVLGWLILNREIGSKEKILSLLALLLFTALPYLHFKTLEQNRDAFLLKANPSYCPPSTIHPRWHSIYIGFGYLKNPYGIEYSDTISHQKALSIDPNVVYCSEEYEQILKKQCFLLAKSAPLFVIQTILIKGLALLIRFILFANFGLLAALFYVKPSMREVFPFAAAALFYALPGVLTMPIGAYVVGLASIATIFGIYMICLGIEKSAASMKYA